MNEIKEIRQGVYENFDEIHFLSKLKFLKFSKIKEEYIVSLIDESGYTILKGYGKSSIEAINDLHHNLI